MISYRKFKSIFTINLKVCYCSTDRTNLHNLLISMPKEPKHVASAQKQRQKIKEKSQKYVPGTVNLQVLGSGAEGAPRALYLFTDHARYLFNCGEGTQRLAHEHKMKLSRLEHIFITQPAWTNIGGLPGLALTIQDVGVSNINLHGPPGLVELFSATSRFVVLRGLHIEMADCGENKTFEDNVMTVQYVPITKPPNLEPFSKKSSHKSSSDDEASTSTEKKRGRSRRRGSRARSSFSEDSSDEDIDYFAYESKKRKRSRRNSRSGSISSWDSKENGNHLSSDLSQISNEPREQNMVMSYICRLKPRPGALSLEKCVEMGVPPGPLLGMLKNGEDVELENGSTVKSKDVCAPDEPGPIFIVVDCPEPEYLNSLIERKEWIPHQLTAEHDEEVATTVLHFTPPHVANLPRYQTWLDRFPPSTQHISINSNGYCLGSAAVHKVQNQLNLLDEQLFPLLGSSDDMTSSANSIPLNSRRQITKIRPDTNSDEQSVITQMSEGTGSAESFPLLQSCTLWNIHMRPKKGLDRSNEIKLDQGDDIAEAFKIEGFQDVMNVLKQEISEFRKKQHELLPKYPNILFLGTGSCIPNKTRNTSGILLQVSEQQYMLLDCGEGTFGQIIRFFGLDRAITVLKNIKAVYISHLHADHHIGLVGFITGRRRVLETAGLSFDPLYLFAPKQIMWWLNMYHKRFEPISKEFQLLANGSLILDKHLYTGPFMREIYRKIHISSFNTVPVKHCPNAFGVAIETFSGHKITYSGDTMPCKDLIQLGQRSDVLIHEATMEDDLVGEARVKMHSTTSQAITAGNEMDARFVLLTHFSQRYARIPRIPDTVLKDNVGIAFDNMKVTMHDLPILYMLYPALKILFHEHCEELENKAAKRSARAIRSASIPRTRKRSLSIADKRRKIDEDNESNTISTTDIVSSSTIHSRIA